MGNVCCAAHDLADADGNESFSSAYANVLRTHLPSPGVSPTHALRESNTPKNATNPLTVDALHSNNDVDASDGAANDVHSPIAIHSSPATHHPNIEIEMVQMDATKPLTLCVPQRNLSVIHRREPSPRATQQQQQQQGEGLAHLTAFHSRSGRANSISFATFDGIGSSSGVDQLTENQLEVMQQAVFAAESTTTYDTVLSSLGAGDAFPSAPQLQAAAVRQRSSFFTATGTDSGTDVSMMAMEPSLAGFVATHQARSGAPNLFVSPVEDRPHENLPIDEGSWFGRDSMSLHSASGRRRQSTASFAGHSAVAVPMNSADGRLRLAMFQSQN
jgi:hypothetical protein